MKQRKYSNKSEKNASGIKASYQRNTKQNKKIVKGKSFERLNTETRERKKIEVNINKGMR